MVDATSVVAGVQERDKWRHRVEFLERSLSEVQERRRLLERRLRRLTRELTNLQKASDAVIHVPGRLPSPLEVSGGAPRPVFR